MRILAVSTPQRLQANPNIPTMTEQGIPMSLTGWFAAMVPSATPRPIVEQINKMFNHVTATEDAQKVPQQCRERSLGLNTGRGAGLPDARRSSAWGDYVRIAKIEPQG